MVIEVRSVASTCHEKFHLLSLNTWGIPKQWISEGMAVACDGNWWGYSLHELTHYLLINNQMPKINLIIRNNRSFRSLDSRFSYPVAGSLIQYIDETYGRKKLLNLWKSGDIKSSLGINIETLERDWKKEIENYSVKGIEYLPEINFGQN